jgi:microcystin-dependent protein
MAYSRRSYKGAAVSNALGGSGLAANATSITLAASISGWSTSGTPFFVVVDPGTAKEEKICVIYTSTTTLTVVDPAVTSGWTASVNGRGVDDTTDYSHSSGAVIYPVFTATEANQANELVSKYTVNGDIVVHGSSGLKTISTGGSGNNHKVLVADSTVADGGVKWAQITADGIAENAVTQAKMADNSVGTAEIINASVGLDELATAVMNRLVPVGTIAMFGGAAAPTGWLLCDGTSTSGYTALAAIVGGTTPDLCGRVPVGAGTGAGLTARTLDATGGAETHTLTTAQMPSHSHGGSVVAGGAHAHFYDRTTVTQRTVFDASDIIDDVVQAFGTATTATDGSHQHTINAEGGGSAHNIMQPFRVVNYIIKHD